MGLSINELTEAIRQNIDENMEPLVAEQMAEHALGFFGYYDRIIDNALSTRSAKEKMWAIKKSKKARDEATEIVQRHASMKRNR